MSSLLQSTRNTRALPTGSLRFIRSDLPEKLTDEEVQWLLDNNITTIIDLRSDEELAEKICTLKNCEDLHISICQLQAAVVPPSHLLICIPFINRCSMRRWIPLLIQF